MCFNRSCTDTQRCGNLLVRLAVDDARKHLFFSWRQGVDQRGPLSGIPEDHVTGSAHTTLAPYWAEKLGKRNMLARQISQRGNSVVPSDAIVVCYVFSNSDL